MVYKPKAQQSGGVPSKKNNGAKQKESATSQPDPEVNEGESKTENRKEKSTAGLKNGGPPDAQIAVDKSDEAAQQTEPKGKDMDINVQQESGKDQEKGSSKQVSFGRSSKNNEQRKNGVVRNSVDRSKQGRLESQGKYDEGQQDLRYAKQSRKEQMSRSKSNTRKQYKIIQRSQLKTRGGAGRAGAEENDHHQQRFKRPDTSGHRNNQRNRSK